MQKCHRQQLREFRQGNGWGLFSGTGSLITLKKLNRVTRFQACAIKRRVESARHYYLHINEDDSDEDEDDSDDDEGGDAAAALAAATKKAAAAAPANGFIYLAMAEPAAADFAADAPAHRDVILAARSLKKKQDACCANTRSTLYNQMCGDTPSPCSN